VLLICKEKKKKMVAMLAQENVTRQKNTIKKIRKEGKKKGLISNLYIQRRKKTPIKKNNCLFRKVENFLKK
jgi:hypothetical protein